MYAIVRGGGRQHKVTVGDVVEVNAAAKGPTATVGATVEFPALLMVDGDQVIAEPQALSEAAVVGEVIGHTKGPKIRILKYKAKTGYRKRQGHRQRLALVKITQIAPRGDKA
ncbi:MAG: 50S ribosomal protein L21 [Acidothermus sp.]|nr:50S ribosomal protein L21 [Acidothermus sp.]MCL6537937.1 50S ribosomal protein L21 [Acidothermus sp.]